MLWIKHKLRKWSINFEYWTANLVVPHNTGLASLIENTNEPKFDEYFDKLDKLKKTWKIPDHELDKYAIQGRLIKFKWDKKIKV